MPRADARQTARNDLAALGHKPLQQPHIAVADRVDLLRAELANLLSPEELTPSRTAARTARRTCSRDRRVHPPDEVREARKKIRRRSQTRSVSANVSVPKPQALLLARVRCWFRQPW